MDRTDANAEASTSSSTSAGQDAAPVVFKKRSKAAGAGGASSRSRTSAAAVQVAATAAPGNQVNGSGAGQNLGATDGAQNDDDEDREGTPGNLADLIALRKLRQSTRTQGIEIEKLNAGLKTKKKKRKQVDAAPAEEETYGLQKRKGAQDEDSDDNGGEDAITRKIRKSNNFTHQTGIVDVDKHMMAYIERELQKRRAADGSGASGQAMDTEKELAALDPRDELYQVAEKYKVHSKPVQEGNVATSAAMLTAIPEVDLGIDSRLKNIEQTEMARRKLADRRQRQAMEDKAGEEYHEPSFAGSRYFRYNPAKAAGGYDVLRAAKLEAGAKDDSDEDEEQYMKDMKQWMEKGTGKMKEGYSGYKGEYATDDIVADRFKKYNSFSLNGRGRR